MQRLLSTFALLILGTTLSPFAACGQTAASRAATSPRIVETQYPTDDYVIATVVATETPYNLRRDGNADCTAGLQAAIDDVAARGGGVVYLPSGRYRFDGNLVLKEGVTLRGDWLAPGRVARVGGTVLMPYAGRGQNEGPPFISMYRGTGVRNLSIWYPEQDATNPVAYPWTMDDDLEHTGNNFTIHQVTLVNPYQAIRLGPKYNELFTLRQVYGTPLKTGFQFDSISDIGRILNVRFGPRYWQESGLGKEPDAAALSRYLFANGTALEMRRSEWQYIYDVEVQGYARGLHIRRGEHGSSIGVATNFRALGCDIGMLVGETRLVAVNSRFEGRSGGVVTTGELRDDLQLNNCELISSNGPALRHEGTGAVRVVNSRLEGRGPSLEATQGQITLLNSDVPGRGIQVALSQPVRLALLLGNRFAEPAQAVQNASKGDVQIDNKPLVSQRFNVPTLQMPPDPKPAKAGLYNVLDFGAQPGKANTTFDNTSAFQSALDAAGRAGGGTVYVPGGFYRFGGHLQVPTGVEMRGVFDVPHHTMSLGSVLLPTEGRGSEQGTPFISLASKSGLRGLTIWYPEQYADDIVPFPWTVRSMGPGCWMMDVSTANSYNYVDFGTHPSEGHLLRYVAGSAMRRGIWVSKGSGVVDSCHLNPHYWERNSPLSPPQLRTPREISIRETVLTYTLQHHEAFIFGSCPNEIQANNFVYGANYGMRFVDDNGGTSGWVINHASDACSEGVTVDTAGAKGLNLINTQIAIVGAHSRRAVYIGQNNRSPVNIVGGYSFGLLNVPTMELHGTGPTLVQSWNAKQLEVRLSGGPKRIESTSFSLALPVSVQSTGPVAHLELVGNTAPSEFGFVYAPSHPTVAARGNARALPPVPLTARFSTQFGPNDPSLVMIPITIKDVADAQVQVEVTVGRNGAGLVLSGKPDSQQHALAYYEIYDVNLEVKKDTVLRYYLHVSSPSATTTGIDLVFTDGTTLRDTSVIDTNGRHMHPGSIKGAAGRWWKIEGHIGENLAGKTIDKILFAFDHRGATTPIRAIVDSIEIGEPAP